MAQFIPAPGVGAAPFAARPASPRGLYRTFGAPESLLRIHFPTNSNPRQSKPWFWFFPTQQPQYFSFLAPQGGWGPGFVRKPFFTVVKILPIDTQPEVPAPRVGAATLESAILSGNPDVSWGRFNFQNDHFWASVTRSQGNNKNLTGPLVKPQFQIIKGVDTALQPNQDISGIIKNAVQLWSRDWDADAAAYNALAAGVSASAGFHYPGQKGAFSVPLPDGPPTTIGIFNNQLSSFSAYLGAVPPSAFFNINTITTQAYAFTVRVGQLDDTKWNMSVFPPVIASGIGNGRPSSKTGNYEGFGATDFPVSGPVLV